MQTIDEAAKEFSSYEPVQIGFLAGVEFAQRWISVYEELPEEGYNIGISKRVLVKCCEYGSPIVAVFSFDKKIWYFCPFMIEITVTHWRPINLK